jgi:hypothetical protein
MVTFVKSALIAAAVVLQSAPSTSNCLSDPMTGTVEASPPHILLGASVRTRCPVREGWLVLRNCCGVKR